MVGSLFSKRPRVTGSNCRTSCFAGNFSSTGFVFFTGALLPCAATEEDSAFLLRDVAGGAGSAIGGSCSIGAKSIGGTRGGSGIGIDSGTLSTLVCGWGCCSQIEGVGTATGSDVTPSSAMSPSAASELMMVTLKRFPIRPSTAVPNRICVCSLTWRPSSCIRTSTSDKVIPGPPAM